jgi:zinc transport system substrate-binding protein
VEKLNALDKEYEDACAAAGRKIILFGDRFPFRYLVEDYGIDYYAAFSGCSAETEASFTTVAFLAAKVNELDIPVVFTIENADTSVAEMIVDNSNKKSAKIITMDSLQSVNKDDIAGGKNYIDTMRNNLEVLKEAMN